MPRSRHVSLLIAVLGIAGFSAQAQMRERPEDGEPGQSRPEAGQPHSGQRARGPKGPPIRELAELLELDQKQTAALDAALRERHQQREAMRQRADEQRKATMDASDDRLRKLLTPAQFGKFKQWEAQHRPPPRGVSPDGRRQGADGKDGLRYRGVDRAASMR